jgi:hypothetical protein
MVATGQQDSATIYDDTKQGKAPSLGCLAKSSLSLFGQLLRQTKVKKTYEPCREIFATRCKKHAWEKSVSNYSYNSNNTDKPNIHKAAMTFPKGFLEVAKLQIPQHCFGNLALCMSCACSLLYSRRSAWLTEKESTHTWVPHNFSPNWPGSATKIPHIPPPPMQVHWVDSWEPLREQSYCMLELLYA